MACAGQNASVMLFGFVGMGSHHGRGLHNFLFAAWCSTLLRSFIPNLEWTYYVTLKNCRLRLLIANREKIEQTLQVISIEVKIQFLFEQHVCTK